MKESLVMEEVLTNGNAPIGGRIFPAFYFDEDTQEVIM